MAQAQAQPQGRPPLHVRLQVKLKTAVESVTEHYNPVPDPNLWSSAGNHRYGTFSIAALSANYRMEDYAQVETSRSGVFFAVYDGHGGTRTADYVSRTLLTRLVDRAEIVGDISSNIIRDAFQTTEEEVIATVQQHFKNDENIATVGTCCIAGVIWNGTLYIANLGDSRAVLATSNNKKLEAVQLTTDHNAKYEQIRNELQARFPNDPNIVVFANQSFRVKGIIQVTRSIGDAHLKFNEFKVGPHNVRFHYPSNLHGPALSAVPDLHEVQLNQHHRFIILASDGLWDFLSPAKAVKIVKKGPQMEVAKNLIKEAMKVACRRKCCTYNQLKNKSPRGGRRSIHDDTTVIVVFIDNLAAEAPVAAGGSRSVRPFKQAVGNSVIARLDNI